MSVPARGRRATWGALLAAALVVVAARPARADERRYALVVGVNEGDADDGELAFAEQDAVRMADVLRRLGGVAAEDLVLMRGSTADEVLRALAAISARIAERRATEPDALLLVYYSGHASGTGAHLRGTQLPFGTLTERVRSAGAGAAVLIVDACRSGGLTRVKGGVVEPAFSIKATDELQSAGLAIISSSAAGEDAQESDRLRGGIFTHHFVSGLLGAADANGDIKVTLSEAYDYAHRETVRTTSRTRLVQHPTYAFNLKGRRELVLTQLTTGRAFGAVQLREPGTYVLMERDAGGHVLAELASKGNARILVPPGHYLVRRREPAAVWEQTVVVDRDQQVEVAQMTRMPYAQTVRKGLMTERQTALGLSLAGEVGGPTFSGLSPGGYLSVGLRVDFEALTLSSTVRWGRATSQNDTVTLTQDMVGVDLALLKVFDLPGVPLGLGIGLRVGGDWFHQRFDTLGDAPDRSQWVWRAAPVVRFEAALHPRVSLTLDAGVDVLLGNFKNPDTGAEGFDARVVPFGTLGFVVYLP